MSKTFRMDNLIKVYNKRKVVDGASFNIKKGEVIGLLGPNGAGKTTSFYMSVGFVKPDSGKVYIDGQDVTESPMHIRARLGVGYLAQEASIFRKLTVAENLEAILETMNLSRTEIIKRRDELLIELQIMRVANQKGYTLSGGERRRCEIARALVTNPDFILLDEPFAGVDPIAVKDIQTVIGSLKERGLGILITDHNVRETLKITDRAYIMYSGRILISGSTHDLVNDPETRRIYLGEDFTL
ncbi:LPS export ABC transporter ATP-binding protein [Leptospira borgpetersenii]|uniref:ATP-binding protein of an ABC transporter complex n=2 Tax=Leptospira borgpetersenii serovar Hardjo-bovis TaxID=338217 RepID=Q04SV0_LEPBJ|nr:LPS export ABC transporter ATP-binding protein [Leptospira borgpetersenii]ABJ76020.1 ATP-binding protein of an ABC transporter complex [Leptospira borgpetersenii serovar Hardjo-bovis str. JB197]ABJ79121.1 ATP-binding protein of an ABC transporter complex [Leptospira borgpetersenii serovar Hardjo-bovis str. L550]AMX58425.1 ABC transporter ATP-binding protein [Leptospira borgpetersenii serovar Hardjo]AMX61678.1 ABC transporter ATP-binding protein [Leptospira borgpetersenii serovar Hardjo]AMX6